MCKHLIAISDALRLEGCVIPLLAKSVPFGQKRKRGAPAKKKCAHFTIKKIKKKISSRNFYFKVFRGKSLKISHFN